jgi:chemotaxis signal transduction protein
MTDRAQPSLAANTATDGRPSAAHRYHPDAQALLVFRVGAHDYVLPLAQVVEVVGLVTVTPLLHAKDGVVGMVNRHGTPVPLLDLRRILNAPLGPLDLDTLWILTHHTLLSGDQTPIGLIIDEVEGVLYFTPPPNGVVHGMIGIDQRLLQWLDLAHLYRHYLDS